ncbi:hypothetical protein [Ignatzschineria cameli]|uniref:Uncharacterized protein n=1 Tax=Ignatzschineria cameli TaxID=2182793 RepID=A0A2U2AKI5_9GAMM|nr:hypothetical protein [Ignatzschineria cameli]PWD82806.1 hypothetical protein DC080_10135 [Ignatzschineria cameli]PWD83444.1 hypothetical protein DC077_09840 [Ignatzschineria cameli]PWD88425.1 hypothetical protein DC079_09555 [Ignatzschineria cameli]PWD88965.1 hypothetical protein DC081_09855 [Ignatzschineria cameli]PWD89657.1 hypothetical protein DC078_09630 [Ignatzschineria cameli]
MSKQYGVRMTLPPHATFMRENLLGPDFKAERWFESEEARQKFLDSYQKDFIYYRVGDRPRYQYELIEK